MDGRDLMDEERVSEALCGSACLLRSLARSLEEGEAGEGVADALRLVGRALDAACRGEGSDG